MEMEAFKTCNTVCFNQQKIRALRAEISETADLEATALCHKALGHPARLAILRVLEVEECCVCDLANILGRPVSTVSQHLRMLSSAGLIKSRQEGKLVFYTPAFECAASRLMATVTAPGSQPQ